MRPPGISINALARAFAVPPNRIGALVNGTRAITAVFTLRPPPVLGPARRSGQRAGRDLSS